ncbi:MAG TPA: tRNA lysidine(34) synthetase TilS, partial [Gemmatimonadales bacterium]
LGGSGPAGLAGMNGVTGVLVRPLLPFGRAEIRDWLATQGVVAWEDPANVDPRHLRSWLRTRLMPLITGRIPDVDRRVERLARLARQNRAAWDATLDALPLDLRTDQRSVSLLIAPLTRWPAPLALMVLQAVARRAGLVLGPVAAQRVLRLVRDGQSGQRSDIGRGVIAERAFDRLILGPDEPPAVWEAFIQGDRGQAPVDRWRCRWQSDPAPERHSRASWIAWLTPGWYRVRPWQAGDRILPLGGTGRRLVVRCMQDARVPRSERSGWPVVVLGQEVVWVPGIMRSAQALPEPGVLALLVEFSRVP